MMRIDNYEVQFDEKVIFQKTSFHAYDGQLTLITGESGSGKTTLLNSLRFHNQFKGEYIFNDEIIENQEEFINEHISVIEQFPFFLNDLTIEQHFHLFGNDYVKLDQMNVIERLGIKSILKEYPNQLSDGEKKRVALCLAFFKNSVILLADEPTASLDEDYAKVTCQLLKEYASLGHCVIAASHDLMINDYADCIYHIQNCELHRVKESSQQIKGVFNRQTIHLSCKNFFYMFKTYVKKKTLLFICLSMLVVFVGVSSEFNNVAIATHKGTINELSSRQIQVYKSISGQLSYSENGSEFPITSEELELLNGVNHIESIHWRYDFSITDPFNEKVKFDDFDEAEQNQKIVLYEEEKEIKKGVDLERVFNNIVMKTYSDEMNFGSKIDKSFQKDGIYISRDLALELMGDPNNLKGKTLQIPVRIPVYDASGVSTKVIESGEEFPINSVGAKSIYVKFPIAGILKSKYMYDMDNNSANMYQIYIPQSFMKENVEIYKVKEVKMIYWVFENQKWNEYVNEMPKGKEIAQTIKATPWQPNNYIIEIDDLSYLNQVLADIHEIGFDARCTYIDSESLMKSVENMQIGTRITGGVILFILFLITYQVKKNNREIEKEGNRFLENMGLSFNNIRKAKRKKYFIYFICKSLVCILLSFVSIQLLNILMYGHTEFSLLICVIIILVSFIIEFIYPTWLERR